MTNASARPEASRCRTWPTLLLALRRDPGLRQAFAYDEMLRQPVLRHVIGDPAVTFEARTVSDEDVIRVAEYLQRAGLKKVGSAIVREGIAVRARANALPPGAALSRQPAMGRRSARR